MFGKTMSIPDSALRQWWELLIGEVPPQDADAMAAKLELARRIVTRWHGEEAAVRAEAHFTRVVRQGGAPEEVPEASLPDGDPLHLPAILASAFGLSTSEARRMIAQGGVKLDGAVVSDLDVPRSQVAGALVQAGKRRFVRYPADS
jgi:tyrosyl-tRNA synthetase